MALQILVQFIFAERLFGLTWNPEIGRSVGDSLPCWAWKLSLKDDENKRWLNAANLVNEKLSNFPYYDEVEAGFGALARKKMQFAIVLLQRLNAKWRATQWPAGRVLRWIIKEALGSLAPNGVARSYPKAYLKVYPKRLFQITNLTIKNFGRLPRWGRILGDLRRS